MSVFGPHFDRVYNNHQPADLSILEKVPQCPTLFNIDSPITFEEVNAAINKLKNGNIPGLNGIPPEAYKAMNVEMLLHVTSSRGKRITRNGTRANVFQCPSQEIYPTQINGKASC